MTTTSKWNLEHQLRHSSHHSMLKSSQKRHHFPNWSSNFTDSSPQDIELHRHMSQVPSTTITMRAHRRGTTILSPIFPFSSHLHPLISIQQCKEKPVLLVLIISFPKALIWYLDRTPFLLLSPHSFSVCDSMYLKSPFICAHVLGVEAALILVIKHSFLPSVHHPVNTYLSPSSTESLQLHHR